MIAWRSMVAIGLVVLGTATVPMPVAATPDVRSAAIVPGEPIIIRPGPAQTLRQEEAAGWTPWQMALAKTASFRAVSAVDALATVALFGWAAGSNLSVAGIAALSGIYFLHDWAWSSFGPPADAAPLESAAMRLVSYRLVSASFAALSGIGTGGDFALLQATAIGDLVLEGVLYFVHELAWLRWGPPVDSTL